MFDHDYLKEIPDSSSEWGASKVLLVRMESIHVKHILTEIFVRKTIDIEKELEEVGMTLFEYLEFITDRFRHIYKFPRSFELTPREIDSGKRQNLLPFLGMVRGLKVGMSYDWDGVLTDRRFRFLYDHLEENVFSFSKFLCSANPGAGEQSRAKGLRFRPSNLLAMKGKRKKLRKIIELSKRFDYFFHIDDEEKYLKILWLFGVQTYRWDGRKVRMYTRKSK